MSNTAPTFQQLVSANPVGAAGRAVKVLSDGRFLVAHSLTSPSTYRADLVLSRYNSNGTLDTSFGASGKVLVNFFGSQYSSASSDESVSSLVVDASGKILVSGSLNNQASTSSGGTGRNHFFIARFNADGSLDTSFSSDGKIDIEGTTGAAYGGHLTLTSDQKAVLVGTGTTTSSTAHDFALFRFTNAGGFDSTFSGDGKHLQSFSSNSGWAEGATAVVLNSSGQLVVGGYVGTSAVLLRFTSAGNLDTNFASGGRRTATELGSLSPECAPIVLQDTPTGNLVLVATSEYDISMARYSPNGQIDSSFGQSGVIKWGLGTRVGSSQASRESLSSAAIQADGKILVSGSTDAPGYGSASDSFITRFNKNGTIDTSFGNNGTVLLNLTVYRKQYGSYGNSSGEGMTVLADGKILLVGSKGIVRLTPDGKFDPTLHTSGTWVNSIQATEHVEDIGYTPLDRTVTVSDSELSSLNGGKGNFSGTRLTLERKGGANSSDGFSFGDGSVIEGVGYISYNNASSGSITSWGTYGYKFANWQINAGRLTIDFVRFNEIDQQSVPTEALVNAVASSITYKHTSDAPPSAIELIWTFSDGVASTQTTQKVVVRNVNDLPTGAVQIQVNPAQREQLIASHNIVDLDNGPSQSIQGSHQWIRNGQEIQGATSNVYTLQAADLGTSLSVRLKYVDAYGTVETVTSAATAPVSQVDFSAPRPMDLFLPPVDVNAAISVRFDEAIQLVTSGIVRLEKLTGSTPSVVESFAVGSGSNRLRVGADGQSLELLPTAPLAYGTSYRVSVEKGALQDLSGNQVPLLESALSFATEPPPDTLAPKLTIQTLASAHIAETIFVPFDEPIQLGSGPIYVRSEHGSILSFNVTVAANQLVLKPSSPLPFYDHKYTISLAADAVRDAAGNQIQEAEVSFRSIPAPELAPPAIVSVQRDYPNGEDITPGRILIEFDEPLSLLWSGRLELYAFNKKGSSYLVESFDFGESADWAKRKILGNVLEVTPTISRFAFDTKYSLRFQPESFQDQYKNKNIYLEVSAFEIGAAPNYTPTGTVTIAGDFRQGQRLSAADSLADLDGLGQVTYVWKAGSVDLATGGTYTLSQADVGKSIFVVASYLDGRGNQESVSSSTRYVENVNDSPTGGVTILGQLFQGQTLTASHSLVDLDGFTSITYTWKSGSTVLGTGSSYTLGQSDVGKAISVVASYTDTFGSDESVTSETTLVVSNTNDSPVGYLSIEGDIQPGATLTAKSSFTDADGVGTITYVWKAGASEIGTGTTYLLKRSDIGKLITVTANFLDGYNYQEAITSAATAEIGSNFTPTSKNDSFGNLALFGDDYHNDIIGSTGRDVIYGGFGDDRLYGNYGDDLLTGDDGNDELEGEQGNDTLQGGHGNDLITGGTGADWLFGGAGDDTLDGSSGADTMDGGEGNDVYYIDNPDDVVTDSGSPLDLDVVYLMFSQANRYVLGQGIDAGEIGDATSLATLEGNAGNNQLTGNSAANELIGGAGADSLIGGDGADTLYGGSGNDVVGGDAGDDLLIGGDGAGDDTYVGGDGIDTIKYSSAQAGITVDLSASINQAYATAGNDAAGIGIDQLSGIENVIAGDFDDKLVGNGVSNVFVGGTGNDTIDGGGGTDTAAYSGNRANYILKSAGGRVTVQAVGASDGIDTLIGIEALRFADTSITLLPNSNPTGSLSIRGALTQNTSLSAVTPIADADGMGVLSYQWLRDGSAVAGANAAAYGLTQADVGKRIGLTVSYTDTKGYLESVNVTSAQTVANVNDLVKGSVTITGAATEGTTLSVNAAITDVDGLGALRYQWLANGKAIAGATSSTLQLAQSHVGAMISVNVSYTDGGGFAESLTSVVTAKVANVNNAPTGAAAVTGLAAEYSTLTLTTSTIADVDGLGKFTLQWQRLVGNNWVDIAKANAATYKLVASDIGSQVRAKVSYVDLQKTAEVVYSTATAPVANVNDRPVGVPTIVGTLVEGSTLTAAAKITDLDGLGAFSYRWEMLSGGSWSTVGSGVSYTLSNDSMGKQVRLVVSYTDGRGTAEAVTSVASKAITTKVLSLTGTANADVLTGMSGADILIGNVGDDRLNGNAGADRLTGGAGADELTGGSGADTFIYTSIAESSSSAGIDTITDFMAGDKISLAAIDANPTAKGDQAFAFKSTASANSVWTAYDGTNTIVSADSTGDTNAELIIKLTGQVNLIAADFIL